MERGPLALFGAILAVGLGPALWLGAQLGAVDLAPGQRPAPVEQQFPGVDMDFGGVGAGDLPDDESLTTYTYSPLASEVSVRPATAATTRPSPVRPEPPSPPPSAEPSQEPSAEPSAEPSTSDSPAPSTGPSTSASAEPRPSASPSGSPEPSAGPTP